MQSHENPSQDDNEIHKKKELVKKYDNDMRSKVKTIMTKDIHCNSKGKSNFSSKPPG